MTSVLRVLVAAAAVATVVGATGGIATILGAAVWTKPQAVEADCGCYLYAMG